MNERGALKNKDTILKLHEQVSVILRIISCTQKIDVEAFETYSRDTVKI